MSSTLCNVKKSVSVPECFTSEGIKPNSDVYYEEAWDLRMARLGVDISHLNDEFIEKNYIQDEMLISPPTMTRSCIEQTVGLTNSQFSDSNNNCGLIQMTSSAIADSVIANNPVYSFKKYSTCTTAAGDSVSILPQDVTMNEIVDKDSTITRLKRFSAPEKHIKSSSKVQSKSGILLNNNCYEYSFPSSPPIISNNNVTGPSLLVNAIVDESSIGNTRNTPSAFRSRVLELQNSQKPNNIFNNLCYNNMTSGNQPNFSTLPLYGFSRQISAPVGEISPTYQSRGLGIEHQNSQLQPPQPSVSDCSGTSNRLHNHNHHNHSHHHHHQKPISSSSSSSHSRRSSKKRHQHQQVPSQHLYDVANCVGVMSSGSGSGNSSKCDQQKMVSTGGNSGAGSGSDSNYIKHLKGQEIARTCVLRHSRRPECHLQRTINDDVMQMQLIAPSSAPPPQTVGLSGALSTVGGGAGAGGAHPFSSTAAHSKLISTSQKLVATTQQPSMSAAAAAAAAGGPGACLQFATTGMGGTNNAGISSTSTLHHNRWYNSGCFNDSRLDMIADSNRPLEEHLWYHPNLSRSGAEELLTKYPEGSFLVRPSQSCIPDEYSLSIRYKQKWLHMKITRDVDGQFVLGQYSQPYPSIPIMIRHYSCSFLPVKGANLISLTQPIFRH